MSILFGVVVACSDASTAPPPAAAGNAERVVHDHYRLWYRDFDGDGHGDPTMSRRKLTRPDGFVANATDCDDRDATIFRDGDCPIGIAEADLSVRTDDDDAELGRRRTASGDLDGDGTADLAMGATTYDGSVYLLYGPASGSVAADDLVSVSAPTATTGTHFGSAVGAGDANGDGLDDLLVQADVYNDFYLFLGPITADRSTSDADAEFDAPSSQQDPPCVAITRDFDGDGGADLVMTSPYESADEGVVYVATGTASGMLELPSDATYTFSGPSAGGRLGIAMAETGDTNGDGIADLALGAGPGSRVYIVPGGLVPGAYDAEDVAIATLATSEIPSYLGTSVASGDYDGDGAADLFAGAWGARSSSGAPYTGAVYGFLGPLSGLSSPGDASVRWQPPGSISFGAATVADDFDGDGALDVAMGTHGDSTVYLQFGYTSGVVSTTTLLEVGARSVWGDSIAAIPDWTGDGGSELALAAPGSDGAPLYAGTVYVFFSESLQ